MARSDRTAYLLLLGMAVFFGGTWVAGKVAVEEVPPGERIGARGVLGFVLAFAGLVLVVDPAGGVESDRLLGALLFVLGVFGTVLAFVLFYEGLKRIGPGRATSFALLVPVFGVLGAVLLLDEPLGWLTVVGGTTVLAGLWLVQQRPPPREAISAGSGAAVPARVATSGARARG
jgi:drug/metabolite transporter (DMT)-like permease